ATTACTASKQPPQRVPAPQRAWVAPRSPPVASAAVWSTRSFTERQWHTSAISIVKLPEHFLVVKPIAPGEGHCRRLPRTQRRPPEAGRARLPAGRRGLRGGRRRGR